MENAEEEDIDIHFRSFSILIQWWIKKRLKVSEDIQDLRSLVNQQIPTFNDFILKKKIIAQYIFNGLLTEQQNKLKYCIDFIAKAPNNPDVNAADLDRSIKTRDRILRKINKMFLQLVKDIYMVDVVESQPIDATNFELPSSESFSQLFSNMSLEPESSSSSLEIPLEPASSSSSSSASSSSSSSSIVPVLDSEVLPVNEPISSSSSSSSSSEVPASLFPELSLSPSSSSIVTEDEQKPCCSICLDTFNDQGDDVYICSQYGHPIHILCRVALAERKNHSCPSCRQLFEADGGERFCDMWQIEFKRRGGGRRSISSSSAAVKTPVATYSSSYSMPTRSSSAADERRERQEYTNLRNKLIFVLQNKRVPSDILQECLMKMDPFLETSSTMR